MWRPNIVFLRNTVSCNDDMELRSRWYHKVPTTRSITSKRTKSAPHLPSGAPPPIRLDTSLSIPIRPPNSSLLPVKFLKLPYLDFFLDSLERFLARPPRRLPMWGRNGDQDALLRNRHNAEPVHETDGCQIMFIFDGLCDWEHAAQSQRRIGCIL